MQRKPWRLAAAGTALVLFLAACGSDKKNSNPTTSAGGAGASTTVAAKSDLTVGLVYDLAGRGDKSFNDAAAAGYDKAKAELGFKGQELTPSQGGENRKELLQQLAESQKLVIAVGFAFDDSVKEVAAANPSTMFAQVDGDVPSANVKELKFAEEQGSYLVGAAAALKSKSGKIGFIGGVETDLIKKFEAGYVAGAKSINPKIDVKVQYISPAGDFSGFSAPDKAKTIAEAMYQEGRDVIYHAAGASGDGLFQAAAETGKKGQIWAIGVDSDQYLSADPAQQPYILTSMMKRVDIAVYQAIKDMAAGTFKGGNQQFDLKVDGVGYSTSNPALDASIKSKLEQIKQDIISGKIVVPTKPGS